MSDHECGFDCGDRCGVWRRAMYVGNAMTSLTAAIDEVGDGSGRLRTAVEVLALELPKGFEHPSVRMEK